MSRLERDGTAEPVSRDQILRRENDREIFIFPVQLTTCRISNLTRLIHNSCNFVTMHTYIYIHTKYNVVEMLLLLFLTFSLLVVNPLLVDGIFLVLATATATATSIATSTAATAVIVPLTAVYRRFTRIYPGVLHCKRTMYILYCRRTTVYTTLRRRTI